MDLSCVFCGRIFTTKGNVKKHLMKTIECENILGDARTREEILLGFTRTVEHTHDCKHCGKSFAHSSTKYAHQKHCTQNPNNNIEEPPQNGDRSEIKLLIEKVDKLLDQGSSSSPVINNYIQTNQQNNFYIRSIGMENLDHIDHEQLSKYVKHLQFLELVKTINFNPMKPENHNVKRMTTSTEYDNNPLLKFFADGAWNHASKDFVLKQVMKNIMDIYKTHLKTMMDKKEINIDEHHTISRFIEGVVKDGNTPQNIFAFTASDAFYDSENFKEIIAQFSDYNNICSKASKSCNSIVESDSKSEEEPTYFIKAALERAAELQKQNANKQKKELKYPELHAKFNIPDHIDIVVEDSVSSTESSKMMKSIMKRMEEEAYS